MTIFWTLFIPHKSILGLFPFIFLHWISSIASSYCHVFASLSHSTAALHYPIVRALIFPLHFLCFVVVSLQAVPLLLLSSTSMTKHHHQQPSLASEHNGMPSSSKPAIGNILVNETTIEKLTVKQLKVILRAKGCPVSGAKAELINRVMQSSEYDGRALAPSVPTRKPKPWQHSIAKKQLKRALLDPTSKIHTMCASEIQQSNDQYKQYPNFPQYYQALQ